MLAAAASGEAATGAPEGATTGGTGRATAAGREEFEGEPREEVPSLEAPADNPPGAPGDREAGGDARPAGDVPISTEFDKGFREWLGRGGQMQEEVSFARKEKAAATKRVVKDKKKDGRKKKS